MENRLLCHQIVQSTEMIGQIHGKDESLFVVRLLCSVCRDLYPQSLVASDRTEAETIAELNMQGGCRFANPSQIPILFQ